MAGLSPKEASAILLNNLPIKEIIEEPNKAFYVSDIGVIENPTIKSIVARGKTSVSSWTLNPRAPNFEKFLDSQLGECSVILVADVASNNFVINPKNLARNIPEFGGDLIENEQEVIGYGPINVLEAAVIYLSNDKLSIPQKQIDSWRKNLPVINLTKLPSKGKVSIPPSTFEPLLNYLDNIVRRYERYTTLATELVLQNPAVGGHGYKTLYDLVNGIVDAKKLNPNSFKTLGNEALNSVITVLREEMKDNVLHPMDVHKELLKALNLKVMRER